MSLFRRFFLFRLKPFKLHSSPAPLKLVWTGSQSLSQKAAGVVSLQQLNVNCNLLNSFPFINSRSKVTESEGQRRMSWEEEKARILSLELEKKRDLYKCEDSYSTLEDVETWPELAAEKGLRDERPKKAEDDDERFSPDTEINSKVSLWRGDITTLEIDAIVNAANNTLLGGGGVDGAIHRAAGKLLVEECATLNGCDTGDAKITGGYKLPAKYVIHTVGPQGEKPDKLQSCYETSMNLMLENGLKSVAFPCISTGIYGYPNESAAHVALKTTRKFLEQNKDKVDRVIFTLFLPVDVKIYSQLMHVYFPLEPTAEKTEGSKNDSNPASPEKKDGEKPTSNPTSPTKTDAGSPTNVASPEKSQ